MLKKFCIGVCTSLSDVLDDNFQIEKIPQACGPRDVTARLGSCSRRFVLRGSA